MERTLVTRRRGGRAMAVVGSAALAAGLVGSGAVLAQESPAIAGIGTPEKPVLTLGYRLPSYNSVAPLLVAKDRGYWQDCGLQDVQLVQTEEVTPGLVSGSLDVGLIETIDGGQAQIDGLPLKIIAGYRPYSRNIIAVRPEIGTPADLAGKDILLGGTPGTRDADVRLGFLREAGYDLTGVPFNAVTVEGGSDAWVALLLEGKLFLTPVFNRHVRTVTEAGMQLWVDQKDFGSDHVAATTDFIAANPNSTAAFLCGLIQGIQVWQDPANKEYILGLAEATGIEITQGILDAYELDIENYDPFNGGWPMDRLQELFDENLESHVDAWDAVDVSALHVAQQALGLEPDPALPAS
jgi:ABC-type nitrate/sulfonate/bicarbonate transport system substrate-binding protein